MAYFQLVNIDPSAIDVEDDFWETNPQLKYYPVFKELYNEDKSKKKVNSSKTMWCLWMICDPHPKNKVFHQMLDDQKEIIKAYFPKFPWSELKVLQAAYDKYCISRAKRDFVEMMETLTKRKEFLNEAEYHFDRPFIDHISGEIIRDGRGNVVMQKGTAKDLDAIHKNTLEISNRYEKAEKIFIQSLGDSGSVWGNREKTLRESGGMLLDVKDEDEEE